MNTNPEPMRHFSGDRLGLTGTIDIRHAAEGRHPAVRDLARWLDPNPNLSGLVADVATLCERLGSRMLCAIPEDTPELTAGLRKLLEAKDCFVRAMLDSSAVRGTPGPRWVGPPGSVQAEAEAARGSKLRYPDDPELQKIYDALPADDCGHLMRQVATGALDAAILHCRLLDGHSTGHEMERLA